MTESPIRLSALKKEFERFAREKRLKTTRQREAILDIFFRQPGHISVEDLLDRVRRKHPGIGYATVYRTMKLLCEAELAEERRFGTFTLYEKTSEHHDHFICTRCGRIDEFESQEIERLQDAIARKRGFAIAQHKHEIYGTCSACRERS